MSSTEEKGQAAHSPEKFTPDKEAPPAFESTPAVRARDTEDFYTRNGLNFQSFKRRPVAEGDIIDSLDRSMKGRHLQMIAIGGSIGAGFFVGSGGALRVGGPGWVLIDFLIIGIMMFNTVYALGELAVMYPVSGGFYTYSTRFIDPSWGFAMGWNYVMQWAVVLPLELTVCGVTVGYWNKDITVGMYTVPCQTTTREHSANVAQPLGLRSFWSSS
jgi:amino acid transporter